MVDPTMSLDEFLVAVSGPWVQLVVGTVLSFLVDYWSWFERLPAKWKRLVFFALCMVVPVAAALLRVALGYVSFAVDPLLWQALVAGFVAASGGTAAHTRQLLQATGQKGQVGEAT